MPVDDELGALDFLASLTRLSELELKYTHGLVPRDVVALKDLTGLTKLTIGAAGSNIFVDFNPIVASFTNLRNLQVVRHDYDEWCDRHYTFCFPISYICMVLLASPQDNISTMRLASLTSLVNLESVEFRSTATLNDEEDTMSHFPRLRILAFRFAFPLPLSPSRPLCLPRSLV
jgi:hypothetical protein